MSRKPYPSDVLDAEWALLAPYLTLMREDAPQRVHPLREILNGLRYALRAGVAWRMMHNDLPPWRAIHRQAQRWIRAGCFEHAAHDLREILAGFHVLAFCTLMLGALGEWIQGA